MKIDIRRMVLHNFKGARHLDISFVSGQNNISGRNATGKTTVFDAFLWCLFGKDSTDRTDFNIKTLTDTGEAEHHLEHFVELHLIIDDQKITLKRVLEEKWTKPKEKNISIFSGHETSYYVNDVPCSQKEYNLKVETICRPDIFKFITNPLYFPSMPWNKQRDILSAIVGSINESDIPKSEAFVNLINRITGKSLKEYRAEIAKKKQKAKEELETIDPRIKENNLKKSEVLSLGHNYEEVKKNIENLRSEILETDKKISEIVRNKDANGEKKLQLNDKINKLKISQQRIESEVRISVNKAGDDARGEVERLSNLLKSKIRTLSDLNEEIRNEEENIISMNTKLDQLRTNWQEENNKVLSISDEYFECPTCHRPFDEAIVETKKASLASSFNNSKANRLSEIDKAGQEMKTRKTAKTALIEELKLSAGRLDGEIIALRQQKVDAEKKIPAEIVSISPLLEINEIYQANKKEIEGIEVAISEIQDPNIDDIQKDRRNLELYLSSEQKILNTADIITDADARVEKLTEDQIHLNQIISDYERDENLILEHTKEFIQIVEERVNSMFKIARFKMFNLLINGNEEETCECMVSGVPFRDLNNGMKIAVGIDIINTMSDYYHIHAPIFIDNAEAINEVPETRSQVVGLFVTEDETLQINGKPVEKTADHIYETINA